MLATTRTALDPLVVRLARRPVVEENRSAQAIPQAPHATKDFATAGAPQRDQFPYYLIFTRSNLFVARVGIFRRLHGVPFGSPNTLPRGPWLRVPALRRVCCSTGVAGRAARLPDLVDCPRTLRSRVLHSHEVNGDVASRESLRMRGERSCS